MNSKSVKEGGKHNMYSKSKRFIASFLAVLMAVCMLPMDMFGAVGVVNAAETALTATFTDGGASVAASNNVNSGTSISLTATDADDATDTTTDIIWSTDKDTDLANMDDTQLLAIWNNSEAKITKVSGTSATVLINGAPEDSVKLTAVSVKHSDADNSDEENPVPEAVKKIASCSCEFTINDTRTNISGAIITLSETEPKVGAEVPVVEKVEIPASTEGGAPTEVPKAEYDVTYSAGTLENVTLADKETELKALAKDTVVTVKVTVKSTSTIYKGEKTTTYTVKEAASVAVPTASTEGEVASGTKVTLSHTDNTAKIYYVLKEAAEATTAPAVNTIVDDENEYKTPIDITAASSIFAVAQVGGVNSDVKEFKYTIKASGEKKPFTLKLDFDSDRFTTDTDISAYDDGYFSFEASGNIASKQLEVDSSVTYLTDKTKTTRKYYNVGGNTVSNNYKKAIKFTPQSNVTVKVGGSSGSENRAFGLVNADKTGLDTTNSKTIDNSNKNKIFEITFTLEGDGETEYAIGTGAAAYINYVIVEESAYSMCAPVSTPKAGAVQQGTKITLSAPDGVNIYWAEGTTKPVINDTNKYDAKTTNIIINATKSITVVAKSGDIESDPVTYEYTVALPYAEAPRASVDEGVYESAQTVTLSSNTSNAKIYYTTDGTNPLNVAEADRQEATAPITVDKTQIIRAYAISDATQASEVVTLTYIIKTDREKTYKLTATGESERSTPKEDDPDYGNIVKVGEEGYFTFVAAANKSIFNTVSKIKSSDVLVYNTSTMQGWPEDLAGTLNDTTLTLTLTGGTMQVNSNTGYVENAIRLNVSAKADVVVYYAAKLAAGASLIVNKASQYDDKNIGTAVANISTETSTPGQVKKAEFTLPEAGVYYIGLNGQGGIIPYMSVTENKSTSTEDTVAITPTISADDLAKLDGATLCFTATGETDVPVTASGTAVQLKKGVTYSLVAKKANVVDQTITAKINGNASYEVPNAAASVTITVEVESLTANITPTISAEEAAKLDGAKVYFTAAGETDAEVVSGTALQLKKGTTYTLVVKKNNVTDETMAAKINGSTEYEVTADATVAITIVTGLTPAERVAITPSISDDDLAKLNGAKVYFTAPGEKLEVTSGTAVNLKKEVKYTLVVEKDGTTVANTTAQIGASAEYTPTAVATVTITISVTQAPTKPAAPTANPASGNISVGGSITLLPAGAEIYYNKGTSETSVTVPTASTGTRYTAPIQATEAGTLVIKAIAVENGLESEPATFTYTVRESSGKTGFYVELADDGVYTYTGSAIKPAIKVYNNDELLTEGVDYTVKYANNVNASTKKPATLTVTGKGRFSGSQKVEFNIAQKSLGDAENDIIGTGIETGNIVIAKGSKAAPVIIYNGVKLANKDIVIPNTKYNTVTAEDTPDAEKTVIITAKENGNFTGSLKLDVKVVEKKELKNYQLKVALTKGVTYTYNGSEQEVSLDVKDANGNLLPGADQLASEYYYVSYNTKDRTNAGVVKFTVYGTGDYAGSVSKSFTIKPADKNKTTVNITGEPWSGNYEVPYAVAGATLDSYFDDEIEVNATVEGVTEPLTLKKDRDYKVTYSANKKSGTAKATVSFIGNYKGIAKQQQTFTIKGREVNAAIGSDDLEAINMDVKFGATKPYKKEGIYKAPVILSMDGVTVKNSEFDIKYYTEGPDTDGNFDSSKEMKGKNKLVISSEGETPTDSATVYVELTGKTKGNFAGSKITGQYQVYKEATYDLSKAKVIFYSYDAKKAKYVAGSKMPYTGEAIVFGSAADDTDHTPYLEVKIGKDTVPADAYKVEYVNNTLKGKATVIIVPNTDGDERTAAGSKTVNFTITALNLKSYKDVLADLFHTDED